MKDVRLDFAGDVAQRNWLKAERNKIVTRRGLLYSPFASPSPLRSRENYSAYSSVFVLGVFAVTVYHGAFSSVKLSP